MPIAEERLLAYLHLDLLRLRLLVRFRFFLLEAVQFRRHIFVDLARLAQVRFERAHGPQLLQFLLARLTLPILALLAFLLGLFVQTLEHAVLTLHEGGAAGSVVRCCRRLLGSSTRKLP